MRLIPSWVSRLRSVLTAKNLLLILCGGLLYPVFTGLLSNATFWLFTREKVEISLSLDSWKTMSSHDLENFIQLDGERRTGNLLKLSWKITNTGSRGIQKFEENPTLTYPDSLTINKAIVSQSSSSLRIDKDLVLLPEIGSIQVGDIGVFNPGDFFVASVYISDVPDSLISLSSFADWKLKAKATDLKIRQEVGRPNIYRDQFNLLFICSICGFILILATYLYSRNNFQKKLSVQQEENKRKSAELQTQIRTAKRELEQMKNRQDYGIASVAGTASPRFTRFLSYLPEDSVRKVRTLLINPLGGTLVNNMPEADIRYGIKMLTALNSDYVFLRDLQNAGILDHKNELTEEGIVFLKYLAVVNW